MLIIIHGDDAELSRKKLSNYFKDTTQIFDGAKCDVEQILTALTAQELFASKKIIVIEQFLPLLTSKAFMAALNESDSDRNIVIVLWEDSILSSSALKKFPKAQVFVYQLPKYFFSFLDGLCPKNAKHEVELLHKLYPAISEIQIFYAMAKRVRLLLMEKSGVLIALSDGKKLSPWQKQHLERQASMWDEDKLMHLYLLLYDLEKSMKTSSLTLSLREHIDILLITSL